MKTTAQEIQSRFLWLLVLVTLIMGVSVTGMVGYKLVKQSEQSSVELMASLKRAIIDDRPDWDQWRKSSSINTKNTYVRVHNSRLGNAPGTYYTPNTKAFLSAKHYQMPFFPAVAYSRDYGFTYYRSGTRLGIKSEIWLRLAPVTAILLSVMLVVLMVMILTVGLGWLFIRLTARKITKPLAELNVAAQNQAGAQSIKATLPIPTHPKEVHQLALSINDLLTSINDHAMQEREFISNAAHELRTPIAAIRGHVRLVERRGDQHPEIIPRSIQFIDDESARMQRLVNSLLTLSRADRGTLKLTFFDATEVIRETVAEERAVREQSIVVKIPDRFVIWGNAESLQQILMALIDNAGKYSPGDQPITITAETGQLANSITVQDLGPGIADADKEHVFERFYRVDTAHNQAVTGTGLGLAIVSQLIKMNQAEISILNNQPQGTKMQIKFFSPATNSDKFSE